MYHLNHVAKDVARGIMQWDSSKYAGFSTVKPWIGWYQEEKYNVADQEADSDSILNYYRKLLFLKKESLFIDGSFDLKDSKETLYIYERLLEDQKALIYCNFSDTSEVVQVDQELQKKLVHCHPKRRELVRWNGLNFSSIWRNCVSKIITLIISVSLF